MSRTRAVPRYRRGANAIASLAASALVAIGLVAVVAAPSQASTKLPLQFTATVSGGVAYTGDPLNVGLTITNPGANKVVKLNHVAIVIPRAADGSLLGGITPGSVSGVGVPIRPGGASGPGNWIETIRPCGKVTNCSAIVVIDAAAPRTKSGIAPGQSVTAYVGITAPTTPQTLTFRGLECDDAFALPGTASINVVRGDAAKFLVTVSPGSIAASGVIHITVKGVLGDGVTPRGYKGGQVRLSFGQGDGAAVVTSTDTPALATTPDGTKGAVLVTLPPTTSTQSYGFDAQLFSATLPDSTVTVAEVVGTVTGTSNTYVVVPGVAATIAITGVAPVSGPLLTAGQDFMTSFRVTDAWNNVIPTSAGDVSITEDGAGSYAATAGDSGSTVLTDGTKHGTYSVAGTINLTAHLSSPSLDSAPASATFVAFTNSALFLPGTGGTLSTGNLGTGGSCTTADNCSNAGLPQGANGTVTISMGTCSADGCNSGSAPAAANLQANLKDANNQPLYSAASPASLTYVCSVENCAIGLDDRTGSDVGPSGTCTSGKIKQADNYCYNLYNNWEESVEDAQAYRIIAKGVNDTTFYQVQACQSNGTNNLISGFHENAPVGSVTTVPAGVKSCIDLTTVTRNLTTGDLSFGIYYYDDYIACRC